MLRRVWSRSRDDGFTLVELLIVIVVLGVLASIVVIAVSAVTDRGEGSACEADVQALQAAEEAAFAQDKDYLSEPQLESEGYIREESTKHKIVVVGGGADYEIRVDASPQPSNECGEDNEAVG